MSDLPQFADIQDAAERLSGLAVRTPLLTSEVLDSAVSGRVFIKAECLQRGGAFKFRGAYNRISRLSADERMSGVVAYSSGNHARAVALAAGLVGVEAVVVMPADAPESKIAATRALGAEVVLYDRAGEAREAIADRIAQDRGAVLVPPFEDFHVIAGQGTVGLEIAEDLAAMGVTAAGLLCPVSGGGLIGGIALAMEALSPTTRLFAVEPAGYDDYAQSLAAGHPVEVRSTEPTLCDALMVSRPGDMTFAINHHRLSAAYPVSDEEVLKAMAFAFRELKLVLEPGGAAALALLLSKRVDFGGGAAVVVASGGNVDSAIYARALAGAD